jgi:hypothetical protein
MGVHRSSTSSWLAIEIAALLILTIGCGGPSMRVRRPGTLAARPRPSQPAEPVCAADRLCAMATFDGDAIDVTLRIDPALLPQGEHELSLTFSDAALGEEYARELREGIGELGPEIQYRVELARARASWRRPNGWHLTGRSFLPELLVDGERIDLPSTLVLDTGELPLWTAAGEEHAFDADSLARLADEAYEVGPLFTERVDVGSTVLTVASSEETALEPAADILSRALRALTVRLGPPPAETLLYVFHAGEDGTFERLGSSITVRGALPTDAITAHAAIAELVHLWNPGPHTITEAWLGEGVSDYLVVAAIADVIEAPSIASVAVRAHRRYRDSGVGERTLRDESPAARDAGLALGFCLDGHLRESGSSLGAVLRTMLTREERELGAEAFLEDLAAISPSSASYLEALLVTEGAFAIDDCVERAGFRAREVSFEGWNDTALQELLGLTVIEPLVHAQGFEVREVREGSQLAAGDLVLEVEGVRTADLDDVAWALRNTRAGQHARVVVRRNRETEGLSIEVPALDDDQREERAYVELAPIERSVALY